MNEPVILMRDFLRSNMIDPDATRLAAGTNWIYDDFPRHDLSSSSYPRVSIIETNESSEPLGFRSDNFWTTIDLQVDIWVKEDTEYTIDTVYYADIALCRKIARDTIESVRNNWTDLADANSFLTIKMTGKTPPNYDFNYKVWRITIDYEFETNIKDGY